MAYQQYVASCSQPFIHSTTGRLPGRGWLVERTIIILTCSKGRELAGRSECSSLPAAPRTVGAPYPQTPILGMVRFTRELMTTNWLTARALTMSSYTRVSNRHSARLQVSVAIKQGAARPSIDAYKTRLSQYIQLPQRRTSIWQILQALVTFSPANGTR